MNEMPVWRRGGGERTGRGTGDQDLGRSQYGDVRMERVGGGGVHV